jgi:hypothetical protein
MTTLTNVCTIYAAVIDEEYHSHASEFKIKVKKERKLDLPYMYLTKYLQQEIGNPAYPGIFFALLTKRVWDDSKQNELLRQS